MLSQPPHFKAGAGPPSGPYLHVWGLTFTSSGGFIGIFLLCKAKQAGNQLFQNDCIQRPFIHVTDTRDGFLTAPGLSSSCSYSVVNQSRTSTLLCSQQVTNPPNPTHRRPVHPAPAMIPGGLSVHEHSRQDGGEGARGHPPLFLQHQMAENKKENIRRCT